jgi:hypothetical protein
LIFLLYLSNNFEILSIHFLSIKIMSLLSSASLWSNDEGVPKKRQSSMKRPTNPNVSSNNNSELIPTEPTPILLDKYSSLTDSYNTNTFIESMQPQTNQSDNINTIINKMAIVSAENAGNQLADFNPIAKPNITIKKPDQTSRNSDFEINSPEYILKTNIQNCGKIDNGNSIIETYSANDSGSTEYSNYNNSYDPSKLIALQSNHKPYYSKMGINANDFGDNSKLLEKLNYMIHLMEEQQNEKTANITEEFILYTFLGIFVIFIVDSFARSGKYVR